MHGHSFFSIHFPSFSTRPSGQTQVGKQSEVQYESKIFGTGDWHVAGHSEPHSEKMNPSGQVTGQKSSDLHWPRWRRNVFEQTWAYTEVKKILQKSFETLSFRVCTYFTWENAANGIFRIEMRTLGSDASFEPWCRIVFTMTIAKNIISVYYGIQVFTCTTVISKNFNFQKGFILDFKWLNLKNLKFLKWFYLKGFIKMSWHLRLAFSSISGFEAHCPRFNDVTGARHVSLTFQLVAKRSARTACRPFVSVKSSLAFPLKVPHSPLVLSSWSGPTVTDIIFIPILTFEGPRQGPPDKHLRVWIRVRIHVRVRVRRFLFWTSSL